MRLPLRRAAMSGVALVAALGASGTSASAAGSGVWTVGPGGSYTAHASSPAFTFPAATFVCTSSTASGSFATTDADGVAAGTFTPTSFSVCSVGGIPFTYTAGPTPWKVNLLQRNAANPSRIDVSISGVTLKWSATGCNVTWTGTAYGQYDNGTGQLLIGPTGVAASQLVAGPGTSCLGLVKPGDVLTIKAAYALTPKQTITPPA
ncbi:hypothetical protein [Streptomyces sp. NPDC088785]|uniref:hypothetical protein n=1 Tax=Streptomyces sp. NPDC088785 TaxID=3365897 RepID=UPI0037FE1BDD